MKISTKTLAIAALSLAMVFTTTAKAASHNASLGVVDFKVCVENSKFGKEEQKSFEALKAHMVASLEETEKEL
ncbi:MAG: hypothetical protein ACQEP8_06435, partial [Chlamydiota bacterium]